MGDKPLRIRKDVRMSPELVAWVESLPPRYGDSFSEKARAALEIAREYAEKERQILEGDDDANSERQAT